MLIFRIYLDSQDANLLQTQIPTSAEEDCNDTEDEHSAETETIED